MTSQQKKTHFTISDDIYDIVMNFVFFMSRTKKHVFEQKG